jgi:hypothetical protein
VWTGAGVAEQLISVAQQLDAAPQHGLQLWLALAGVSTTTSVNSRYSIGSSTP